MHTNTTEQTSLSASALTWWERLSPERQRAHIKRHPRGKYAKNVKNHTLKLKPLQKKGSRPAILDIADAGNPDAEDQLPNDEGAEDEGEGEGAEDEGEGEGAEPEDEGEGAEPEDGGNAPNQPTPPPPRADMADSYRSSLPDALKAGVRAFFGALSGGQRLGSHADLGGIRDAAASGDIANIVRRMNPPDRQSAGTLHKTMRALMPLAKIAAITTLGMGATVATGGMVPALLAAYYINRHLDSESNSADRMRSQSSEGDECDKLVNSFMDWVESLDAGRIASASSDAQKFVVRMCPTQAYIEDPSERGRYVIVCGNSIRGVIQWDRKYGKPDLQANGWNAVLMHGFNESSWQSGRDKETLEPFTTIFKNDVVLVNPARMPFEYARSWALSVLRR